MLADTRIWRSSYAPPLYRLLWRAGFYVPPLHFLRFEIIFIVYGVYYGATMWTLGSLGTLLFGLNPNPTSLLLWIVVFEGASSVQGWRHTICTVGAATDCLHGQS
jgi:hypothetical protein